MRSQGCKSVHVYGCMPIPPGDFPIPYPHINQPFIKCEQNANGFSRLSP